MQILSLRKDALINYVTCDTHLAIITRGHTHLTLLACFVGTCWLSMLSLTGTACAVCLRLKQCHRHKQLGVGGKQNASASWGSIHSHKVELCGTNTDLDLCNR